MYPSSTLNLKLPEWYTIERSAEKTIEKLNTLRELDYYLKHPDESMRRLAILRISSLKLRDSINSLKEIMDDPAESQLNKELAAWTIKTIALRYDIDLFISHRLLTRFTGNEKLSELFPVRIDADVPSPSFSFSAMSAECRICLQSSNARAARDTVPDMKLDYAAWLSAALKRFGQSSIKNLKTAFAAIGSSLIKLITALPGTIKKAFDKKAHAEKPLSAKKMHTPKNRIIGAGEAAAVTNTDINANNTSPFIRSDSSSLLNRNTGSFIYSGNSRVSRHSSLAPGKILKDLLYYLLFPVRLLLKPFRLLLRHKLAAAAALLLIYSALAFTSYGRVATIKYLGIDLKSFNISAVENIKQVSGFAIKEFNNLIGINDTKVQLPANETADAGPAAKSSETIFTVATKKGLNVRVSPASSAAKAGSILEYGTKVTYLDKSKKDSEGRLWYYIKAADGTTGWVYSGGLSKKEG